MIPHQANRRIIAAAAERLGINCDRVVINIDQYGNTTGATIPLATRDALALREAQEGRSGAVRRGGRGLHRGREFVALADVAPNDMKQKSGGVWMPRTTWHRAGSCSHGARLSGSGFDRTQVDITDSAQVERTFAQEDPAIVINAAAYNQVDVAEKEPAAAMVANGLAVRNLAMCLPAIRRATGAFLHRLCVRRHGRPHLQRRRRHRIRWAPTPCPSWPASCTRGLPG